MMLFLFVLMLVGRESSDSVIEVIRGQRLWAVLLGIGVACLLIGGVARALVHVAPAGLTAQNSTAGGNAGNVGSIGRLLFTDFLFAFELTSALLITAAVAAMVLTNASFKKKGHSQRDLVFARFRGERARPSPYPGPGVFATADSVATPALLPDGSVSAESLSRIIESAEVDGHTGGKGTSASNGHALVAQKVADAGEQPDEEVQE